MDEEQVDNTLANLIDMGLVKETQTPDGEFMYTLTPQGRRVVEDMYNRETASIH